MSGPRAHPRSYTRGIGKLITIGRGMSEDSRSCLASSCALQLLTGWGGVNKPKGCGRCIAGVSKGTTLVIEIQ